MALRRRPRSYLRVTTHLPCIRWLCRAALRRLNDPSNHTLSSYAYILMSLSVLLSRAPNPVVPCLQELAPEWPARSSGDALAASDLPLELRLSPEGINYDTYFWQPPQASDLGASAAPTASLEKGWKAVSFAWRSRQSFGTHSRPVSSLQGLSRMRLLLLLPQL